MKRKAGVRALTLLMAALLLLPLFSFSALADEYDPLYPEKLDEGHLTATSAILIEADTGNVIFSKNPDQTMAPASTTKILTILVALSLAEQEVAAAKAADPNADVSKLGLNRKITVSQDAVNLAEDESSAKLAAGEEVALIDLLYAAVLTSGNDAANAIAEGMAGDKPTFVAYMNQVAASIGCTNSHFANPHGLTQDGHYTTARDMALIAQTAMQNEIFREIAVASSHVMPKDNIYRSRTIQNRNYFVNKVEGKEELYYEWGTGIKTGTTEAAGNCFVGSAARDGINLISVVFNATKDKDRYLDTIKLMEYGFSQYISTTIQEIYLLNPRVLDIRSFDLEDPEVGRLTLNIRKTDPAATDLIVTTQDQVEYWVQNFSSITVTEFTREFKAPITEGEVMGTLTYYPESGNPVMYELTASRSIAAREQLAPSVEQIIAAALADPNPFPRITFELILLHLILPALGIVILIKILGFLRRKLKRQHKVKAFKPTSRYYR